LEIEQLYQAVLKMFRPVLGPVEKIAGETRPIKKKNEKQARKETVHVPPGWFKININMESQFYQINLLQLLLKWKFHLGVIVVIAALLAVVFSGPAFITPKFKSHAVVYPANIAPYSDENETEQMLQIFQSNDITDSIIEMFDLPTHYGIDRDYKYYYTTMMWEYSQNVKISKTPNEAVSIEVLDSDPQIACDMVNSMIDLYNRKVRGLHENKFWEVVGMYERALTKKSAYLDSLNARLTFLSKEYGLMDYEAQSEQVTKGYLKTIDGSGAGHVNNDEVKKLKANIETMGAEVLILQNLIASETRKYSDLKDDYEKAYMDFDRQFTYTNVLTKPFPADKKAYPIRWLILVISVLASFFISFVVILILENYKGMAKKS
jgi:capsule polysaccharide export protein KpsE/RkpR